MSGLGLPQGHRVAVLGAGGGIGRALVAALLAEGARVAALDLPASLAGAGLPDAVLAQPLDATDAQAVASAFEHLAAAWGALDGFVNLAGFTAARRPVAETGQPVWDEVISGNLTTAYLGAQAALPLLRLGTAPAMVLMASGLAAKAAPGYGPYAAAKAGVLSLTRVLAAEAAPAIRVNAVAPAAVDTAFLTGGTGRASTGERFDVDAYQRTVPLGRIAVPADVVGPILFLLGPGAAYITGQSLHINGGLLMP
jgi:3-oxoacyl-[acyl-carrier protein] reductase